MKITTWNVNGLRSALNKGIWNWVQGMSPDVLCLQEIKTRPDQLNAGQHQSMQDYRVIWNPAERPGYSGVATFYKNIPLEIKLGLDVPRFDVEGRVIRVRYPDFLMFNVYFPSGQRGQERVAYKLDFYGRLLEICDQYHVKGEQIVLCGDFNTAHNEIDLRNPRENQKTSGFLPEERAWIDYYLDHGFVDIYRDQYPDRVQYTWWTYRSNARQRNVGWRLDYFLISKGLLSCVEDIVVHDEVDGSDHCPVTLILEPGSR